MDNFLGSSLRKPSIVLKQAFVQFEKNSKTRKLKPHVNDKELKQNLSKKVLAKFEKRSRTTIVNWPFFKKIYRKLNNSRSKKNTKTLKVLAKSKTRFGKKAPPHTKNPYLTAHFLHYTKCLPVLGSELYSRSELILSSQIR